MNSAGPDRAAMRNAAAESEAELAEERIRDAIRALEQTELDGGDSQAADMDSWLLPYVDTITTLLAIYAFFIGLMEFPSEKRAAIEAEIHREFTIPALIQLPEIKIDVEATRYVRDAERLLEIIKSNGLERDVAIKVENGTARLTIDDAILFTPGSAAVSESGDKVLRALGPALDELPGPITVAGHTDATPIADGAFASNLELSFARAMSVINIYTSLGIPQARFRAAANAATAPVADDRTPEGRAANRRVEIAVELNAIAPAQKPTK
ncbi:MAG: flagellar motor protein MotB [Rhodospirillaceae bacterium]